MNSQFHSRPVGTAHFFQRATRAIARRAGFVLILALSGCLTTAQVNLPLTVSLNYVNGIAADAAGNVYLSNFSSLDGPGGQVIRIPAAGGPQTDLINGQFSPFGVAVDKAGNVYVTDSFSDVTTGGRLVMIPADGSPMRTVAQGFADATYVAVDAKGNVYVADGQARSVTEFPPGGGAPIAVRSIGFPSGLAVDGSGNIYVASPLSPLDAFNAAIWKFPAAGGAGSVIANAQLVAGLAADAAGNVYVAQRNNTITRISASGTTLIPVNSGDYLTGVAVDPNGVLYAGFQSTGAARISLQDAEYGEVPLAGQREALLTVPFPSSDTTFGTATVLDRGPGTAEFQLDQSRSTCTPGTTYPAGSSCVLDVTFAPGVAGLRAGGVAIRDSAGGLLDLEPLNGTGMGPAIAFGGGAPSVVSAGALTLPTALAVDPAGDLFILDSGNGRVLEVPAAGGPAAILTSGLGQGTALALDGFGDVLVADRLAHQLRVIPAAGGPPQTQDLGSVEPNALAVDAGSNILIADGSTGRVLKLPFGVVASASQPIALVSGLSNPTGLSLDAAGNLYITDNGQLLKAPAGGGTATPIAVGLSGVGSVVVDAAGDLFVADSANAVVLQLMAGGGFPVPMANLSSAGGLALDDAGNLYVADTGNNRILKLQRAQAPAMTFPATPVGSRAPVQSTFVQNIGNQALILTGLTVSANFAQVPSGGADCVVPGQLAPGTACTIAVAFTPGSVGPLNGSVTLTDNAMNRPGSTQAIPLTGSGLPGPLTVTPSMLDFGTSDIGAVGASQSVAVTNTTGLALTMGTPGVTGNYAVTRNTCVGSIAIGASCSVSVQFRPLAAGTNNGILTIRESSPAASQTVTLIGVGNPHVSVSPAALAFGAVHRASNYRYVKITNDTGATLSMGTPTVEGDFALRNECGAQLAPGAACRIGVQFRPAAAGALTGVLHINDAFGGGQSVALSGQGI